jgi:hypothetical protein
VNEKSDLIIEFITRVEGLHKIYLYLNDELVDEKPFYINVQTNDFEILSQPNLLTSKSSLTQDNMQMVEKSASERSLLSTDSHLDSVAPLINYDVIRCSKTNQLFYYVLNDQNIQGLCVYGIFCYLKKLNCIS